MQTAHTINTPYISGLKLKATIDDKEDLDSKRYPIAFAIGIFRYLVDSTRRDLELVETLLARRAYRPRHRHWLQLRKIALYLQRTLHHGLITTPADQN